MTKITFAAAAAVDHTSAFAAVEKGFFHKEGLEVNVKMYPTGVEIVNALASGEAQFGILASSVTVTDVSKGLPVRIVAMNQNIPTQDYYNKAQGIVAAPGTGIDASNPASLKGKKIGVPAGTGTVAYVNSVLQSAGVPPSSVSMVNIAPADAPSALQAKSVDAVALWEPWPSTLLSKVTGSVLVQEGGAKGWYDPAVVDSTAAYTSAHPDTTKKVLTAIAEAQQWCRHDVHDCAVVATHWMNGLTVPVAERALKYIAFDIRMTANVIKGLNATTVPFLRAQGKIQGSFDASKALLSSYAKSVTTAHPDLFSDLPPVAADQLLG